MVRSIFTVEFKKGEKEAIVYYSSFSAEIRLKYSSRELFDDTNDEQKSIIAITFNLKADCVNGDLLNLTGLYV